MNRILTVLAVCCLSGLAYAQAEQEQIKSKMLACFVERDKKETFPCLDDLAQELSPDLVPEDMILELAPEVAQEAVQVKQLLPEQRQELRQMLEENLYRKFSKNFNLFWACFNETNDEIFSACMQELELSQASKDMIRKAIQSLSPERIQEIRQWAKANGFSNTKIFL